MIQTSRVCLSFVAALAILGGGNDLAAESIQVKAEAAPVKGTVHVPKSSTAQSKPQPQGPAISGYTPPNRGAPEGTRTGGGNRGTSDWPIVVELLAPDHLARTISNQPTLYFFVSDRVDSSLRLTINDLSSDDAIEPLVETMLPTPIPPGIHGIRLSDYAPALEPGKEYGWEVAVVRDEADFAKDIFAGNIFKVLQVPPALRARLNALESDQFDERISILFNAGLWYDGMDELSRKIATEPHRSEIFKKQRAELLREVGVSHAAAFDSNGFRP